MTQLNIARFVILNSVVSLFLGLLISALISTTSSYAKSAEAVWVETGDDINSLIYAKLVGDEWLTPSVIHTSEYPLSRPSMATLPDGGKMLIWSEQQSLRSVLMSMRKVLGADGWQSPQLFSAFGVENTGASLLVDLNGELWVFWASNNDGLDDIYYVKEGIDAWSEPQRVNAVNEVPDHLPTAINLQTGDVQLSWQSFNFVSSSYLTERKVFKLNIPPPQIVDSEAIKKELMPADVSLPTQMRNLNLGIVHFPINRLMQTFSFENYGR